VDVASLISFRGIFEPLRDPAEFASVYVDPEAGTIGWPNGADLDPLVLYSAVTNRSIESLITTLAVAEGPLQRRRNVAYCRGWCIMRTREETPMHMTIDTGNTGFMLLCSSSSCS